MRVGSSQEYKQDSHPAYYLPTLPDSRQVASMALEQTVSSQPQLLLTLTAAEDSRDQRCSELHGCSKPDASGTRIWSEETAWCKRAGNRPEVAGTGCAAGDA
jgi:hypothetical protein